MSQTQTNPTPVATIAFSYTQYEGTVKAIESACGTKIIGFWPDMNRDPVEDILARIPTPYRVKRIDDCGCSVWGWMTWLERNDDSKKRDYFAIYEDPPKSDTYNYVALPEGLAEEIKEKLPSWVRTHTLVIGRKLDTWVTLIDGYVPIILYTVLPVDKAIELKTKAPWLKVRLMQIDVKTVERLTGQPFRGNYDPKKAEYPREVITQAVKIYEIKGGNVRYVRGVADLLRELSGKKVAVFDDTIREVFRIILNNKVELVETCGGDDCVEVNPPGYKSGYWISFPSINEKLTPEQIAEMIKRCEARIYFTEMAAPTGKLTTEQLVDLVKRCEARIYHIDVDVQEVPLCP